MSENRIIKYIKDPKLIILFLNFRGCLKFLDDKTCSKWLYYAKTGRKLNLDNPKRFTEKIQWLKVFNHDEKLIPYVDKISAKKLVGEKIGEEHIIKTLGVYDTFDQIDFDKLPNSFVIKCNHDCGSTIVCKDKNSFDKESARKTITSALSRNFYNVYREWLYKSIKPKILVEEYIEDKNVDSLIEYKFFCFDGEPKFISVGAHIEYNGVYDLYARYFDCEWNINDFRVKYPDYPYELKKPTKLNEMIEICKTLSKGMPFVRVDLYYVNDTVYFSELTFTHAAGYTEFTPEEYEKEVGNWINISNLNKGVVL